MIFCHETINSINGRSKTLTVVLIFVQKETLVHLFCECNVAITFYRNIQQWVYRYIIFACLRCLLYGITPSSKSNALLNNFSVYI